MNFKEFFIRQGIADKDSDLVYGEFKQSKDAPENLVTLFKFGYDSAENTILLCSTLIGLEEMGYGTISNSYPLFVCGEEVRTSNTKVGSSDVFASVLSIQATIERLFPCMAGSNMTYLAGNLLYTEID